MERNSPKFRLLSISNVQLTNQQSTSKIELTPFDLYFLSALPIQCGVLIPKQISCQPKDKPKNNTVVDHLKISFSRALEIFPPLAGRLAIVKNENKTSSFFIDCNNTGALIVHAIVDNVKVKDILDAKYVSQFVHSFFPTDGLRNYEGVYHPLLVGQITELKDGFFISCSINHLVGDGSTFMHFFSLWSEISRGSNKIQLYPIMDRSLPGIVNHPVRISTLFSKRLDDNIIVPPLEQKIFYLKKEKIEALKRKANSEIDGTHVSSIQALYSLIWLSVVRCQFVEDSKEEVIILFPVDVRSRLKPSLPKGYFGNTIYPVNVVATVGELLDQGLGQIALLLNKQISSQTDQEIRNFLKSWGNKPIRMDVKKNVLLITDSPKFNIYGNDFGLGKPMAVGFGLSYAFNGHISVTHGSEDGSIEVHFYLGPKILRALEKDKEFMNYFESKPFVSTTSFSPSSSLSAKL